MQPTSRHLVGFQQFLTFWASCFGCAAHGLFFGGQLAFSGLGGVLSSVRYIICAVDTTVFPANGAHLQAALHALTTLMSMSSNMIGYVLYPQFQSQTSGSALVKHRHLLDNALLKGGVSLVHHIQLLYSKPDSTVRDTRPLSQTTLAVFNTGFPQHAFHNSHAVKEGKLGPCPLLRIGDFLGYDSDLSKPEASARVEQKLAKFFVFLFFIVE